MVSLNEPFLMLVQWKLEVHFTFWCGFHLFEHLLNILLNVQSMRRHDMVIQVQEYLQILLFVE